MEWFRWYHGAISDPKWPLIARKSGQNIGTVVSIWAALLEFASQSHPRGSVENFNAEETDALFGYNFGTTALVIEVMKSSGFVANGCVVSREKSFAKEQRDIGVGRGEYERLRAAVFQRDGASCFYCGSSNGPFECDHVVPVARGGATSLENMVVACRRCNRAKSSRTVQEWRQ